MHPVDFFEEVRIVRSFKNEEERKKVKEFLKSIHPMNIMGAIFSFQIVKMEIEHTTDKGNVKHSTKYAIMQLDMESGDDIDINFMRKMRVGE